MTDACASLKSSTNNELVLYMHPASYYSKIVLLTLHEKNLAKKYKPRFVNNFVRENLYPWYLKLNPKGLLPVLQIGEEVICGSDVIIDTLEEKFYDGHSKLLPPKDTGEFQKVKSMVQLLRTFQNHIAAYGVLNFPELSSGLRMKEYERKARLDLLHNGEKYMDKIKEDHPEMAEFLDEKKRVFRTRFQVCMTIEGVRQGNAENDKILDQIEREFALHKEDQQHWWLCGECYSEADVTLAILLQRLDELGLLAHLLSSDKRPLLLSFWERVNSRPAFKDYLNDLENLHLQISST